MRFPKIRVNLPYIGPLPFLAICIVLFFSYLLLDKAYMYVRMEGPSHIDYIGMSSEARLDVDRQIQAIGRSLHTKNYGQEGGPWGVIQSHAFYGYSLVNLYLGNRSDKDFQTFAARELRFVYDFINGEGTDHFQNQGTEIEHGIIYQGAKNHLLSALVMVGEEEYRDELYRNSEFLAGHLRSSPLVSGESYPGIAWYIDNVHAYYSLYLTDKLRQKSGLAPLYGDLIAKWVQGMKTTKDSRGITLAEAYGYDPRENQARGCAQSWLLVYMYEMDRSYFDEQYPLYNEHFYRERAGLGLSLDTPDDEPLVNRFSSGPTIFGYSSSATALSLPLYRLMKDTDRFQKTLRTMEAGMHYDMDAGEYEFVHSSLLDSLALWGKTHVTWGDRL